MSLLRFVVFAVLLGCGMSAERERDSDPDVGLQPRPELGGASAPELAEPAAQAAPDITSVETADGFTQLRQQASVSIVIRGHKLQHTTAVSIASLFVTLDEVSPHQVRATVTTYGATAFGPLDVTLTTKHGTAEARGALELTPFIVSPTGAGGHGTYQSPMGLCDAELELAGVGSRVTFLAGTHHCDRLIFLGAGATLAGDPTTPTILTGTAGGGFGEIFTDGPPTAITTIRDLTFAAPLAFTSISTSSGGLLVERVIDAGGIAALGAGRARIDQYTYDGEGVGLDVTNAEVTRATIRHCGANAGIHVGPWLPWGGVGYGDLLLDDVTVEDCERGVDVGTSGPIAELTATIRHSRLIDNRFGLFVVSRGTTTVNDLTIRDDPSTSSRCLVGIFLGVGALRATEVEITGQRDVGISIVQPSSNFSAALFGDAITIVGAKLGIELSGIDNRISLRNSTVRDQTEAAFDLWSIDTFVDLGLPSDPGHNALSVVSGLVIDDHRRYNSELDKYIWAVGTTLNGTAFEGQTIDGPAELLPYYRLVDADSGLQF